MPRYLKVFAWALASILAAAMAHADLVITTRNVNPSQSGKPTTYPTPTCPPSWHMIHQWNYTEIGGYAGTRQGAYPILNYVSNAVCTF
jgi:hypothetical protein